MIVLFKRDNGLEYSKQLETEFGGQIDGRLKAVIYEIGYFCYEKWGIKPVITCLNRTKEENKKVGGVKWSAHLYGRAVDLRTRTMTKQQIDELQKHLESVWGSFLYVKYHDAGSGNHLHINIRYAYRRHNF